MRNQRAKGSMTAATNYRNQSKLQTTAGIKKIVIPKETNPHEQFHEDVQVLDEFTSLDIVEFDDHLAA